MCKTGGPRCATHVGAELKKALVELDKVRADPKMTAYTLTKAKKVVQEKLDEYDSTPTGQKKLEAEIEKASDVFVKHAYQKRLNKSKNYREIMEQKGREARQRIQDFEDLKKQAEDELENPTFETQYKNSIAGVIMNRGFILEDEDKAGWGGPSPDYRAEQHFQQCGVMASNNIQEEYSWQTYDTFTTEDKVGMSADVTCNCGKEMNRKAVLTGANMQTILSDILNNNKEKSY